MNVSYQQGTLQKLETANDMKRVIDDGCHIELQMLSLTYLPRCGERWTWPDFRECSAFQVTQHRWELLGQLWGTRTTLRRPGRWSMWRSDHREVSRWGDDETIWMEIWREDLDISLTLSRCRHAQHFWFVSYWMNRRLKNAERRRCQATNPASALASPSLKPLKISSVKLCGTHHKKKHTTANILAWAITQSATHILKLFTMPRTKGVVSASYQYRRCGSCDGFSPRVSKIRGWHTSPSRRVSVESPW